MSKRDDGTKEKEKGISVTVCHPSSCPIVLSSCPVVSHRFVVCPSSHRCPIVVVALPHSHSRSLTQHISQVSLFFIPCLRVLIIPTVVFSIVPSSLIVPWSLAPRLVLSHPHPSFLSLILSCLIPFPVSSSYPLILLSPHLVLSYLLSPFVILCSTYYSDSKNRPDVC